MPQIPQKEFYKITEVCRHTDIQPYVLHFWESEFPQLKPEKSRGGQSVYSRRDLDLVLRIKKLLDEEQISIADARKILSKKTSVKAVTAKGGKKTTPATPSKKKDAGDRKLDFKVETKKASQPAETVKSVENRAPGKLDELRRRYEGACEEIIELRKQVDRAEETELKLAEAVEEIHSLKKLLAEAEKKREQHRKSAEKLAGTMKKVADALRPLAAVRRKK